MEKGGQRRENAAGSTGLPLSLCQMGQNACPAGQNDHRWTRARVRLDPNRSQICVSFGSNRTLRVSAFKMGCPAGCSFDPSGPIRSPFLGLGPRVGDALTPIGKCNSRSAYKVCLEKLFEQGEPRPR
jgi:hypothetical protein